MDLLYDIESYDYILPATSIAQHPAAQRDDSRLLVMYGGSDKRENRKFSDIVEYFKEGDLLVVNNTKVFPARLLGRKETGGRVELFILELPTISQPLNNPNLNDADEKWNSCEVVGLIKSSKRPKAGAKFIFGPFLNGIVKKLHEDGKVQVRLQYKGTLAAVLDSYGEVPLPPYIQRQGNHLNDRERYQTIYAQQPGAVAAPTAGLHFTDNLLERIRKMGVKVAEVTLHVGYGTFAPVRTMDIREHKIHKEYVVVSGQTASLINETISKNGKVWAVGTTTLRTLEYAADNKGRVRSVQDWCDLYIYPGYMFKVVRNLITNFHLPKSSLLFLVSALAGHEKLLNAYQYALKNDYRFYSYGDAMAIISDG